MRTFEKGYITPKSGLEFKYVVDREAAVAAAAQGASAEPPTETFSITVMRDAKNTFAGMSMIAPETEPLSWENLFSAVLDLEMDALLDFVMDEVAAEFDDMLDAALLEIDRNNSGSIELDELIAHFLARGRDHAAIVTAWKDALVATKQEHQRAADATAGAAGSPGGKSDAPTNRRLPVGAIKRYATSLLAWSLQSQELQLPESKELGYLVFQMRDSELLPQLWTPENGGGLNVPTHCEATITLADSADPTPIGAILPLELRRRHEIMDIRKEPEIARKAVDSAMKLLTVARRDAAGQATKETRKAEVAVDEARKTLKILESKAFELEAKLQASRLRWREANVVIAAEGFVWSRSRRLPKVDGLGQPPPPPVMAAGGAPTAASSSGETRMPPPLYASPSVKLTHRIMQAPGSEVPALRARVTWKENTHLGSEGQTSMAKSLMIVPTRWCPAPGVRIRTLAPSAKLPFAATVAGVKQNMIDPHGAFNLMLSCEIDNGGGTVHLAIEPGKEALDIIDTQARGMVRVRQTADEFGAPHEDGVIDLEAELELPIATTGVQTTEQRQVCENDLLMIVHPANGLMEVRVLEASTDALRPTCATLAKYTPPAEGHEPGAGDGGGDQGSASQPMLVDLNTFNACVLHLRSVDTYREAVRTWCEKLASETEYVEDGITGNVLRTGEQNIKLGLISTPEPQPGVSDAESMPALAAPLLAPSVERAHGTHAAVPVLLVAEPGAGKTWASTLLSRSLATDCLADAVADEPAVVPLVPVLIHVQRLSRMLRDQPASTPIDGAMFMQYFVRELAGAKERDVWLNMLAQAYEMRALVVVIDGIDEAAGRRGTISKFIRELLVHRGVRVVCTSRPEGVDLDDFERHFVIFNLQPLSDNQLREVSAKQLGPSGRDFTSKLMDFADIRNAHDGIFRLSAFPNEYERELIGAFTAPNRLFRGDGRGRRHDPRMRQRARDGGSYVHVTDPAHLQSVYMRDLCRLLTPEWLSALDDFLDCETVQATLDDTGFPTGATAAAIEQVLIGGATKKRVISAFMSTPRLPAVAAVDVSSPRAFAGALNSPPSAMLMKMKQEASQKTLSKLKSVLTSGASAMVAPPEERTREEKFRLALSSTLGVLVLKRRAMLEAPKPDDERAARRQEAIAKAAPQTTAARLFPRLIARTDMLYFAIEEFEAIFKELLFAVGRRVGLRESDFEFAPTLKDPMRTHEKAFEEHALTFGDFDDRVVVPEACVLDVIRARVICPTGRSMLALQLELRKGFTFLLGGTAPAKMSLARCLNRVRDHGPVHFRHILNNTLLELDDGRTALAELEVHQAAILDYHAEQKLVALEHYHFFRTQLGVREGEERETDMLMEQMLLFLEEAAGVPVLFSMLVLVFKHLEGGTANGRSLPTSRSLMYEQAIRFTLGGHCDELAYEHQQQRAAAALRQQRVVAAFRVPKPKNSYASKLLLGKKGGGDGKKGVGDAAVADQAGDKSSAAAFLTEMTPTPPPPRKGGGDGGSGDALDGATEPSLGKILSGERMLSPSGAASSRRISSLALVMLRKVAAANHLAESRVFTAHHAYAALHSMPQALKLWVWLMRHRNGCPLVKTIEDGNTDADEDGAPDTTRRGTKLGLYQFTHTSFQEALAGQQAIHGDLGLRDAFWGNDRKAAKFLNNEFNLNLCRICSSALGTALAEHRSAWDFSRTILDSLNAVDALSTLLVRNEHLTSLNLSNNGLSVDAMALLVVGIRHNQRLKSLMLDDNDLGVVGTVCLAGALFDNKSITHVSLANNQICGVVAIGGRPSGSFALDGLYKLFVAIRSSVVSSLTLDRNVLGSEGLMEVASGLEEATSVRALGLAKTHLLMMMTFSHRAPTTVTPVYRPGSPGAIRSAREVSRSPRSPEGKLPPLPMTSRPQTMASMVSASGTSTTMRSSSPRVSRPSTMSEGRSRFAQERLERQEMLDLQINSTDEVEDSVQRAVHTNRGFAKFCEALKTNASLTSLQLQNNRIGDQNARLLAYAVFWARKPRITLLGLEGNDLEEPPAKLSALAGLELDKSVLVA